ncbi:MAG TPA: hypothetical protein VFR81_19630 [Longimicrobium sp.]|nr:hypothetical protein [Longimicrobium sp.]
MRHLSDEALARLVDETPGPGEAAHLRDCLSCRRELDEMREMADALSDLGEMEPPAGAWAALETALRAEGLVRDQPSPAREPAPAGVIPLAPRMAKPWYARRPALRAAAAAAIFLLGGAVSWAVLGGRPSTVGPDVAAEGGPSGAMDPVYAGRPEHAPGILPVAGPRGVTPLPGEETLIYEEAVPAPVSGARLASDGGGAERRAPRVRVYEPAAPVAAVRGAAPAAGEAVLSTAEAELLEAEVAYLAALQRYARAADEAEDPQARLAALERLVGATSAALERAPDDAVINGYHMAALRQRDALRRRIASEQQKNWF